MEIKELERERKKVDLNASDEMHKAGNYRMGHININGFQITIENPKGSYRKGKDRNGKEWKTYMHNDYGYFTKTLGKDGDAIDVFIGPNFNSKKIFAVDQKVGGEFDETKVMFCFSNIEQAKKAYLSNYAKDWKGFWKITEVNIDMFKKWLYDGHRQYKPFFQYKEFKMNENKDTMKGRNIILTESQYKDYLRMLMKEEQEEGRYLKYEDCLRLLHSMVDNDFMVYFSNGRVYNCNSLEAKGEILASVCSNNHPMMMPNGRIKLFLKEYGYFEIDNLLGNGEV